MSVLNNSGITDGTCDICKIGNYL